MDFIFVVVAVALAAFVDGGAPIFSLEKQIKKADIMEIQLYVANV